MGMRLIGWDRVSFWIGGQEALDCVGEGVSDPMFIQIYAMGCFGDFESFVVELVLVASLLSLLMFPIGVDQVELLSDGLNGGAGLTRSRRY